MAFCEATTKQGGAPCRRPAGWGTDHPGQGRCKLHGGSTPIKHGLYSKIRRRRLFDLMEEVRRSKEDQLDPIDEVVLLRALIVDFLQRSQEVDPEATSVLIDRLGRLVERAHRIQRPGYIPVSAVMKLQEQMAAVVLKYVKEPRALEAIAKGWDSIVVSVR